jgi:ribose transport system substrate-binding protein
MSTRVLRARRAPLMLLAAGAAVLAVTGCGSSDNGGSTAATASESSATSAPLQLGANKDVVWQKVSGPFTTPVLNGDTYSVDVGGGHTITWKKGRKLRIAAFEYSRDNTYQTAHVQAVQDAAKAIGADVTIFDGQNNPATQRSQIQNALASKKFDAAVIEPIASQPSCSQITNDLPAANILVIAAAQETCGRDDKSGADLWSPGTVAWVGNDWTGLDLGWAKAASDDLGTPTDTLWIGGPSDNIVASLNTRVLKARADNHPNLRLVGFGYTDYTPAKALSQTQNLLKAHPNTGALMVQFGGLVPGVAQAVKQAGKTGKVKIYSIGGTAQDKPAIVNGTETFTVPFYPYTQAYCAVEMLGALNAGKRVPRVVVNDCHAGPGSPDQQNATTITKAQVASFTPQG